MTKKAKNKTKNETTSAKTTTPEDSPQSSCDQKGAVPPTSKTPQSSGASQAGPEKLQDIAATPAAPAAAPATSAAPATAPAATSPAAEAAVQETSGVSVLEPRGVASQSSGTSVATPPALSTEVVGLSTKQPPTITQTNAPAETPAQTNTPVQDAYQKEQGIPPVPEKSALPSPPSQVPGETGVQALHESATSKSSDETSRKEKDSKPCVRPKAQSMVNNLTAMDESAPRPTAKETPPDHQPKKPAGKQNKRQTAKQTASSKSEIPQSSNDAKPSETNAKHNSQANVAEDVQSRDKSQIVKVDDLVNVQKVTANTEKDHSKGQTGKTEAQRDNKESSDVDSSESKVTSDLGQLKPKESSIKETIPTTEKLPMTITPEVVENSNERGKTAAQEVGSELALNETVPPPPTVSDLSEKAAKNTPTKKQRQTGDKKPSKPEVGPRSKQPKSTDSDAKKKDATGTINGVHSLTETNEASSLPRAADSSKKSASNTVPEITSKPPSLEAPVLDNTIQAQKEGVKAGQETDLAHESSDSKIFPKKEELQSKSIMKKKNRQQKKNASEEISLSEKCGSTTVSGVTKSESSAKRKPASANLIEKEKSNKIVSPDATVTSSSGNLSSKSAVTEPKGSPGITTEQKSPQPATTNDMPLKNVAGESADKGQAVPDESPPEQQSTSKKKKRNRQKKKNKDESLENAAPCANIEGGKAQDPTLKADGGDFKTKQKVETSVPRSQKEKQVQQSQVNVKKGKQPAPAAVHDEQQALNGLTEKDAAEAVKQTASSKKRNRRKKKMAAATEEDTEVNQSDVTKSVDSGAKPVTKPNKQTDKPNGQVTHTGVDATLKKKNDSKSRSKTEEIEKEVEIQSVVSPSGVVETDDQLGKFVEVKSKNKRNKKKKINSAETLEDCSSVLSIPKEDAKGEPVSVAEGNVETDKGKTESENGVNNIAKGTTNKVVAPKLSQEAREEKMLKKKLAERAQQKIQKQIESNCLSEAEKSEKYLESITKNLKELTKLRSSRLEDIIQKSAEAATMDGAEEFDYEYAPVQRKTFLASTCHVCKEPKSREVLDNCNKCHLVRYCSGDHQKSDWPAHKDLCQAVTEICKERGTNNLYGPAVGLSAEEYREYRMNTILECSAILNRQLEPYEQEIILYPDVCHTCHLPAAAKLQTCDKCSMVSYCSPEHRQLNHDVWCPDLQLYKSLIVYQSRNGVISPELPVYTPQTFQPPESDMQSVLEVLRAGKETSPLERAALSEMMTGPLTTLFALYKANKVCDGTEKLVVHFVGAEWSFELERADKWEAFLLHLVPNLKTLVLVFVGPEVSNLPQEARGLLQKQSKLCSQCQERGRIMEVVIAPQPFYHDYVTSENYARPDVICAFNAGLYRPKGYKEVDSWSDTIGALLRDPGAPVAVTSYTAEEMLKDVERLQQHGPLNLVLPPTQNPYRSLRPNRNFASDDVTPVIFKNYYITIATSLAP